MYFRRQQKQENETSEEDYFIRSIPQMFPEHRLGVENTREKKQAPGS